MFKMKGAKHSILRGNDSAVSHPDDRVRAGLTVNKNTPPDIKEKLKKDPNETIRKIASYD